MNSTTTAMAQLNSTNVTAAVELVKILLDENLNDNNVTMETMNRHDPLYVVIPIIVIYMIIFVVGVIGNISTCIVISKNRSMHTATNYYLFSLAVSDFLLLITGMPQDVYSTWYQNPPSMGLALCVARGLAAETGANATVLTITAFTVERYVAICHPFLSHTLSKLSRAVRLILVVWLVSVVFAFPVALEFSANEDEHCVISPNAFHWFEFSTVLMFVTPMTLITVLYVLIGLKLRSSSLMKRENGSIFQHQRRTVVNVNSCRQQTNQSTRRVLKMLVAVVVAFFICWAPFHAQRLVAIHMNRPSASVQNLYNIVTYISGILYFLSTCINPLLYNIMSNKFREAFKETLAKGCCCIGMSATRHPDDCAERGSSYHRVLSRQPQRRRTFNSHGLPESTTTDCSASTSIYSTSTCAQLQSADEIGGVTQISPTRTRCDSGGAHKARASLLCLVPGRRRRFRKSSRKRNKQHSVRIDDGDLGVDGDLLMHTTDYKVAVTPMHPSSPYHKMVPMPKTKFCCCAEVSHQRTSNTSCGYFAAQQPNIYSMSIGGPANHVVYRERFEFDQRNTVDDDVISNSSLKDVEALEDELEAYMNELRMRDSQSRFIPTSF